jgi:transposase
LRDFPKGTRSEDEAEIRAGQSTGRTSAEGHWRQTGRQYSAEEKIRIVLEGLRGEENISELCRAALIMA